MYQCPECRKAVANNSYNCIHCGHKFRSTPGNIAAKIFIGCLGVVIILTIIIFLFSLFSSWWFFGTLPKDSNSNINKTLNR